LLASKSTRVFRAPHEPEMKERKMNKPFFMLMAALLTAALIGSTSAGDNEEKIPLDKLPENIKKAVEGAVQGLVLTKAEKETKNGVTVYEVEGKVGAKEYEVKISTDGKVLKVEEETEDDDDDDDDAPAAASRKAVTPPAPPKGEF
jgi:uncharacterized membrane protein YkoI